MEKRGEILNQLAIISDLLEKINLEGENKTVIIDLSKKEFEKIYKLIISKINIGKTDINNRFSVKIGEIEFVFNMSNV
jgi:hypothetical protein